MLKKYKPEVAMAVWKTKGLYFLVWHMTHFSMITENEFNINKANKESPVQLKNRMIQIAGFHPRGGRGSCPPFCGAERRPKTLFQITRKVGITTDFVPLIPGSKLAYNKQYTGMGTHQRTQKPHRYVPTRLVS